MCFTGMFIFALYMTIRFLIMRGKWKIFFLSSFYSLVMALAVFRSVYIVTYNEE